MKQEDRRSSDDSDTRAGRRYGLWLYLVCLAPVVTEVIETGRVPDKPRDWITEVVIGILLAALVTKVRSDYVQLLRLSRTDALTGLGHRGAFDHAVRRECARAQRLRYPLSLLYMDLDGFKDINDRFGHAAGDEVLRRVADAIRSAKRSDLDGAFRIGGDEFAVLLPGSRAAQAQGVVARIRHRCAFERWQDSGAALNVSTGIVERADEESFDAFVRRADAAMYASKRARSRAGRSADPSGGAPSAYPAAVLDR